MSSLNKENLHDAYESDQDPWTTDDSGSDSESGEEILPDNLHQSYYHQSNSDRTVELGRNWGRLPNKIKSRVFKNFGLRDLAELARAAPHTAHEILRLRVKVVVARAHLKISSVIDMLQDTGSVISGSGALIVVVPCSFVNRGLDIFCGFDQAGTVFEFLRRNGYGSPQKGGIISMSHLDQYHDDPNFHSSFVIPSSIHAIYRLTHEATGYTVSVVRSRSAAIAPIFGYHSTILMNWISWDGVHCMYPLLTNAYQGLTTSLSFNFIIAERVHRAISLYRNRGFTLYERCSQIKHHTPLLCYIGRDKFFTLPNGKSMLQESCNPYCKRSEREIDDWWTLSMTFTGGAKILQHPSCITWKLSMQYLGQEMACSGVPGRTESAWIAVEGSRKYYQYNAVKAHNVVDPKLPQVNLNEFQ
ncbi:hypothetical protein BKA70DRAFT_1447525 [Coprinopsis sp. MPI-PUGE-AT-0042]|nr:hypothetical protein BKA70DRAFT_1447525 [Coprinopsis sp. MPI-PUGE-AT-0042]